ncbi:MAG: dimethylallyltransferase [Gammaproteobacteria bacterium]|nr:dimethylallyltransferase [Gammaproteobacteria bacterium]|tara:strand:+ start:1964 stop:2917 length:954 start_codon:yes stop_codon:yes gene_type:complete
MNRKNKIQEELRLVESLIKKDFVKEKTISELYSHIFKSKGKKLRARLCLISSSRNKKICLSNRIKHAAIIELLHTATLIHDDVVDNSPTRRGVKSVNNIWTNAHGVLIGDYIYSKAFIYMVDIGNNKILKELSYATNDISQGELIQLDAINNLNITINKLKKISYFKTGRLFEAAAKTGAILINANEEYIKNISDCAKNLGILFQIKDDLLDYSLKSKIGKPTFQDLKEGKITYPFLYAYKNSNFSEKEELKKILGNKKINKKNVLSFINNLGGIENTNNLAKEYFKKSIFSAEKIRNLKVKQEMVELAEIALNRKK